MNLMKHLKLILLILYGLSVCGFAADTPITNAVMKGTLRMNQVSNLSTVRSDLGLAIGTGVQAWDTQLDSLAALIYTANAGKVVRVNAGATGFELATVSGTGDALTTNPLSQFASTTSAQLRGVLSDESGTGVFLTLNGAGGALTVDATGFNGNLTGTDDTLQEIAQKLDDLVATGATEFDDIGDPSGNGAIALANTTHVWTSTLDNGVVLELSDTDADAAADTTLLKLSHNDGADANVIYLSMIGDKDGTPTTDYIFSQSGFTSIKGMTVNGSAPILLDPHGGNSLTLGATSGNIIIANSGSGTISITSADAGSMDNIVIGGAVPLAGTFTNLTATGTVDLSAATVSFGSISAPLPLDGGATPTVDAFGEISTDNNFFAASKGAIIWYDGTGTRIVPAYNNAVPPTDGQALLWDNTNKWWEPGDAGSATAITAASAASEANHVWVSGGASRAVVESPLEVDPATGDIGGIGSLYGSDGTKRLNQGLAVYAAGTAYSLTNSAAALDFGTTDPTLVIDSPGTYLIFGRALLKYNGATYAGTQTATLKLRRTNNTAADVSNATTTATMRIVTTITDTVGVMPLPPVIYTTSNSDDSISVFGVVSAAPAAGSVDATEASIVAIRLFQ